MDPGSGLGSGPSEMLARIDERTKIMSERIETLVTQEEFKPIRAIVYGMVGMILVGVLGGLLTFVVRQP